MSDPVERVARALDPDAFKVWGHETVHPQMFPPDDLAVLVAAKARRQERAMMNARAAVEAMRVPTEAMLNCFCCYEESRHEILEFWQAAIDEALRDV